MGSLEGDQMKITKTDVFNGCLLASIVHAVMTNEYPELSYEQSWDGTNYSIQNSEGMRGTITFTDEYCIGAIRNERSDGVVCGDSVKEYMKNFPSNVVEKASEETLQYLLLEIDGKIQPCISSAFWADNTSLYYEEKIAGIHNIRMNENLSDIRNANDYEESDNYAPCLR